MLAIEGKGEGKGKGKGKGEGKGKGKGKGEGKGKGKGEGKGVDRYQADLAACLASDMEDPGAACAAPDDTIGPGTRVPRALVKIVSAATKTQQPRRPRRSSAHVPDAVTGDIDHLRVAVPVPVLGGVSDAVVVAVLTAWVQIFGLIGLHSARYCRADVTGQPDERGERRAAVAAQSSSLYWRMRSTLAARSTPPSASLYQPMLA